MGQQSVSPPLWRLLLISSLTPKRSLQHVSLLRNASTAYRRVDTEIRNPQKSFIRLTTEKFTNVELCIILKKGGVVQLATMLTIKYYAMLLSDGLSTGPNPE